MEKSSISRIIVITVSFIVMFVCSQTLLLSAVHADEKFFGTVWQNWSSQDQAFPELDDIFDQLTPENAGKWGRCEHNRGNFNWAPLDAMYSYAGNRNFSVKQHTFVWGMQEPGWIGSLSSSEQKAAVINWMTQYINRYPDAEYIDVVNEPISRPPSYKNAIGGSGSTGWDWVIWTFEKARELAPNAKLILNEYSTLSSPSKRSKYLTIINLLKDRGLIDYIGLQAHWLESLSSSAIQNALDEYEATGLPILISELDLYSSDDTTQLNLYQRIFPLFWDRPSVKGITTWGYRQNSMWRGYAYLVRIDGSYRPALTWVLNYMASAPNNNPPSVNAGSDKTITLPSGVFLNATVSDDGQPDPPGSYTTMWTKFSGPGFVTFGDEYDVDTNAYFSIPGTYVLRLTADDSELETIDNVTITVNDGIPPAIPTGLRLR